MEGVESTSQSQGQDNQITEDLQVNDDASEVKESKAHDRVSDSNVDIEAMQMVIKAFEVLVGKLEGEISQLKQQLSEKEKSLTQVASELENSQETITNLNGQLASQQAQGENLQKQVDKSLAVKSKRDAQITHLNNRINNLQNSHAKNEDRWNADIERLEKEIRAKNELFDDLKQKHDDLMSNTEELKVKAVELDKAEDKMEAMRLELDAKEARNRELNEEVNGFKVKAVELDKAEEKMERMRLELDSKEARNRELNDDVNGFKAEISNAIEELSVEIVALTVDLAAMEDLWTSDVSMLKTVIDQKDEKMNDLKQKHDALMKNKEDIWMSDISMLKTVIGQKDVLYNDLKHKHDALMSYKNRVKGKAVQLAREMMSLSEDAV